MTEATYKALSEAVLDEIMELSESGVRSEDIVIVATRDVFSAAYIYDPSWYMRYNLLDITATARFYGYVAGIVNEETGTMFRAAIKVNAEHLGAAIMGVHGFEDMEPGTLIAIDNGGQAKVYASTGRFDGLATTFNDIGITVSFRSDQEITIKYADVDTGMAADMPTMTGRSYQWFPSMLEQWSQLIGVKPEKKVEVQPDTTALDEFLGSFNVLASAT